VAGVMNGESWN